MRPGMGKGRFEKKQVKAKNVKGTLTRLLGYMKKSKWLIVSVTVMLVLSSLFSIAGPYLMGTIVDDFLYESKTEGLIQFIYLLLIVYVGQNLLSYLSGYLMVGVSQTTVMSIRGALFKKLQLLPISYFDKQSDGDLVSRLTNDVDNISNTLNQSLTQLVASTVTLIAAGTMMVILDIRLSLIAMLGVPFVIVITQSIAKFTRKNFKFKMQHLGQLNTLIEETISGQKVVIAYSQEKKKIADFEVKNERFRKSSIKAEVLTTMMGPLMNFTNNIIFALITLVGALMAIKGMTTVGTVVIFINYSRQFARPINQIATLYNSIQGAIAGAERVFEVLDEQEEKLEGHEFSIKGRVTFKNIDFSYESNKPILRKINVEANKGDMIAIVGPTGAGKTTIINLLTRFYDIDSGQLLMDGKDIKEANLDHYRSQLGIVLQDTYLFSGTVMDNIRYGNPQATEEAVIKASKLSNAHYFIHRLPMGYETVLSGEGFGISQGQRQLIAIARAILADPKILILDEATSSVDTRTEKMLQEGLQNLMKGRTSFVIAHRLSTIRSADNIYVIDDGQIIESGDHDMLMNEKGHYHDMYTSQFKIS